jgi:hypothetical protein
MALIDNKNIFSDKQAITETADSTSKVNLMAFMGKVKAGNPYVSIKVTENFATLTSLDIDLLQAATESGSYTSVHKISAIPRATLIKGYRVPIRVLPSAVKSPWLKLVYTVNGSAATAGKIFAALTREEGVKMEAGLYIDKGKTIA